MKTILANRSTAALRAIACCLSFMALGLAATAEAQAPPATPSATAPAANTMGPQELVENSAKRMLAELDKNRPVYAKDPAKLETSKRVVRGYYFLEELQTAGDGNARLLRRFWFDRVSGIRLARLQTFDEKGVLVTDVTYGELRKFGAGGEALLPAQVSITRPQDHYKITITYQTPESVSLDHDYSPDVFVLENKGGLREVDLDSEKRPAPPPN